MTHIYTSFRRSDTIYIYCVEDNIYLYSVGGTKFFSYYGRRSSEGVAHSLKIYIYNFFSGLDWEGGGEGDA